MDKDKRYEDQDIKEEGYESQDRDQEEYKDDNLNNYENSSNSKIPEDIYLSRDREEEVEEKKKKRGFRGSLLSYIALALVASIIGGLASSYIAPSLYGKILPDPRSNAYTSQAININTTDDINTVSAVVKKSMSSVVGITTLETQQFLFQERDVEGLGSGVIVNSDGYILTNSHVVANGKAKEIKVLFHNGDKVAGSVLWNDPTLDLAIVKVDLTNLPVAEFGDSDSLEVGEIAIAIGNPLGLEFQRTVTSGIISGLQRSVRVDQSVIIDDLIQTDASINPGNSGGPLLNKNGQVIGINTAKIQSGEGLGFAIPINKVKTIVEEVIKKGSYETVVLGIKGLSILEYQAKLGIDLGLKQGVIILEVDENSTAANSGLELGDVILKIDDVEVESIQSIKKALYNYKEGDRAEFEIMRNKENLSIEVTFNQVN